MFLTHFAVANDGDDMLGNNSNNCRDEIGEKERERKRKTPDVTLHLMEIAQTDVDQ